MADIRKLGPGVGVAGTGAKRLTIQRVGRNGLTLAMTKPLGNVREILVLNQDIKTLLGLTATQVKDLVASCNGHASCGTYS